MSSVVVVCCSEETSLAELYFSSLVPYLQKECLMYATLHRTCKGAGLPTGEPMEVREIAPTYNFPFVKDNNANLSHTSQKETSRTCKCKGIHKTNLCFAKSKTICNQLVIIMTK